MYYYRYEYFDQNPSILLYTLGVVILYMNNT